MADRVEPGSLLHKIRQHAAIPDAYSWAVLGITVHEARLLVAQDQLYVQRIEALRDQLAAGTGRRCEDCGRSARQLIPVQDAAGKTTGWVGPTCSRKRERAGHGDQLPLQEGAER